MNLVEEVQRLLPVEEAMTELHPTGPNFGPAHEFLKNSDGPDEVMAGLWLYVDDLERAHALAQNLPTAVGSLWHAMVHLREGDFGNAHYWASRSHPYFPGQADLEDLIQDAAHGRDGLADRLMSIWQKNMDLALNPMT